MITIDVLTRVACQSHTFSNGTFIPAGTFVTVPSMPHQLNERNYVDPLEMQPFRFENAEANSSRKHFTTSDPQYVAFGLGESNFKLLYQKQLANDEPLAARKTCLSWAFLRWHCAQVHDGVLDPSLRHQSRERGLQAAKHPYGWVKFAKHAGKDSDPKAPELNHAVPD